MKLKSSDQDSILDFVEDYEKDGIDKEVALGAAVVLARGIYKRDYPDKSDFPAHLKPGQVASSFNKAREERRERKLKDGVVQKR